MWSIALESIIHSEVLATNAEESWLRVTANEVDTGTVDPDVVASELECVRSTNS